MHLATILEKVNEGGVGQQIKLLDNIAGRVGSSTCGAGKPLHWSNRNRMRNYFAGSGQGTDEVRETCGSFEL